VRWGYCVGEGVADTVGHMIAIPSVLVPLETLAGWPTVENPTALQVLGLLFGLPLVVMIVVSVLITARATARAKKTGDARYTDPAVVESKAGVEDILGDDNAASQAALQGGPVDEPVDSTGGASARW